MEYSRHARTQKIITFVGRPLDIQKGICSFLESIRIILTLDCIPRFQVWIVGGDREEIESIAAFIRCSSLHHLYEEGKLLLWGRVDHFCMAEIYSRSTVLVMPSHSETFGLASVEAMMCGCPVVASATGGLEFTVVDGLTGFLCQVDDTESFAASIVSYLRSDALRLSHGRLANEWSVFAFLQSQQYDRIINIYQGVYSVDEDRAPEDRFREYLAHKLVQLFEEKAGEQAFFLQAIPEEDAISVAFEAREGFYLARRYMHSRHLPAAHLPLPSHLRPGGIGEDFEDRSTLLSEEGLTPEVIFQDTESAVIIYKSKFPLLLRDIDLSTVKEISGKFRESGKRLLDQSCLDEIMNAMSGLSEAKISLDHIFHLDHISSEMHSVLSHERRTKFQYFHPQIELHRLKILLEHPYLPIPRNFSERALSAIGIILARYPLVSKPPILNHGKISAGNISIGESGIVTTDVSGAFFAVGNFDLAWWMSDSMIRKGAIAPNFKRELSNAGSEEDIYLCACWLVHIMILRALGQLSRGKSAALDSARDLLHGIIVLYGLSQ